MKISIQQAPKSFELTDNQAIKLHQIGRETHYYWTQGLNGELLDELSGMGLVRAGCGGGSDEIYRLTENGRLVFEQLPKDTPKELPDEAVTAD